MRASDVRTGLDEGRIMMEELLAFLGGAGMLAFLSAAFGALIPALMAFKLQPREQGFKRQQYENENRAEATVRQIVLETLNHKSYTDRSFEAIRKTVGGFDDDELRRLLHEVGAKRVERSESAEGWWYLLEREAERIEKLQARRKARACSRSSFAAPCPRPNLSQRSPSPFSARPATAGSVEGQARILLADHRLGVFRP